MKRLVTFITILLTLGTFGIVSAHSSNNCSEDKLDCQSNGKVFVCHNNGENWVILHEKKDQIGTGDFLYNGPKPREATWCVDHGPNTPPPSPPTPSPTPPTPSPTPPTPSPTPPVDTSTLPPLK